MKKILFASLIATGLISAPAFAAHDEGAYAGISVGSANSHIAGLTKKTDTEFGVLAGYNFSKYCGVEAAYENLGKIAAGNAVTGKTDLVSISTIGRYPISEKASVFGKVGFAKTTTKVSVAGAGRNVNDLTYGVGVQYDVADNIGLRAGYDHYRVGVNNGLGGTTKYGENVWSLTGVYSF